MPAEEHVSAEDGAFRSLLRARPGLEPFLRRLCEGINRRDALQGTVALGTSRGRAEDFEPLIEVLGSRSLSLSVRGEMRLSLDACFAGIPSDRRAAWLDDLFQAVGLTRVARPILKREASAQVEILLERFRVSFPDLEPIHHSLAAKHVRWIRIVLTGGAEDLQASWFQAAKITRFLKGNREAMTLADLGARLCGDSKALKSGGLLRQVGEWLDLLEEGPGDETSESVRLARYHVVENPGAIKATLFGPVVFWKQGRRFDFIREFGRSGEAATLSWENLASIERLEIEGEGPVLSCENESPFHRMQREGFTGVLLYSQGFPNAAVLRLWELLGRSAPEREFLHWGDSDLAGLRIASLLHRVHPLRLHRCDLPELRRHGDFLIPLDAQERTRIDGFLAAHPEFPFLAELEFTGREGWLEQESWRATQGDGSGSHGQERKDDDGAIDSNRT